MTSHTIIYYAGTLKAGYKDAYLNIRFIESIEALLAMNAARIFGPISSNVSPAVLASVKAAFVTTFGTTKTGSSYLSWIGCLHVVGDKSDCDGVVPDFIAVFVTQGCGWIAHLLA
jgi:hypothetical protein